MRRALLVVDGPTCRPERVAAALYILARRPTVLEVLRVDAVDPLRSGLPGARLLAPLSGEAGPALLAPEAEELERDPSALVRTELRALAAAAEEAGVARARGASLVVEGEPRDAWRQVAAQARYHDLCALAGGGAALAGATASVLGRAGIPTLSGRLDRPGDSLRVVATCEPEVVRAVAGLAPTHVLLAGAADCDAARAYLADVLPGATVETLVLHRAAAGVIGALAGERQADLVALVAPHRLRMGGLLAASTRPLLLCPLAA